MKEWILQNFETLCFVGAGIISLITGSSIFSLVKTHLVRKQVEKELNRARENKYWFECPRCKEKVYLDEVNLKMPDGAIDNNLNGKPDISE